jgi:hypothetical protein
MSRPLRLEYPGAVYHISARGNGGQPLFLKDADRERFLHLLALEINQHRWLCHGYCLLEDRYLLVIETPEANLGRGMARLNAVYSQWFNRRHRRSGHLLQGRYKAVLIEKGPFLLEVCRDVALAPVRAGLVKKAGQWPWSSHVPIGKDRDQPAWLHADWLLEQFAGAGDDARKAYRRFVAEGKGLGRPWEHVRGQIFLGSPAFLKEMAGRLKSLPTDQIARIALRPDRPTRDAIVQAVADAAGVSAATVLDRRARQDVFQVTVYLLRRACNLSLKEVAAMAGVSPPRISQIQRAIEDGGGLGKVFGWAQPLTVHLA